MQNKLLIKIQLKSSKSKWTSGFSLVELMVTVAVLAILMTIAVPSFQSMIATSTSATQANELVVSLNKARIEAIKKHRNVVVCASTDQQDCSGLNNWENGWIIQLSSEESKNCSSVNCDFIQQRSSFAGSNSIRAINFSSAATGRVTLDRMGNVANPGGTFIICDYRGATQARAVVMSITGYTKVNEIKAGGVSADIVNDNAGVDISCP